jgi:hypothetical protein
MAAGPGSLSSILNNTQLALFASGCKPHVAGMSCSSCCTRCAGICCAALRVAECYSCPAVSLQRHLLQQVYKMLGV